MLMDYANFRHTGVRTLFCYKKKNCATRIYYPPTYVTLLILITSDDSISPQQTVRRLFCRCCAASRAHVGDIAENKSDTLEMSKDKLKIDCEQTHIYVRPPRFGIVCEHEH